MAKDISNMLNGIDEDTAQILNNFFTMANEAKNAGVELSGETQLQLDTILTLFESLPPEMQEQGRQLLAGLMQGMTDENGNAIDTTNMTCQELVDTAREVFDVNSPSRVFAEIGTNIGLGLSQGIEGIMPSVTETMETSLSGLVTSAQEFNLDGVSQNVTAMYNGTVSLLTQMGDSSGTILANMQKTIISIIQSIMIISIMDFKNMKSQVIIIVQIMSANVVSTMSRMKSGIDGLDLYSSGINIMNGLINGMESKRAVLVTTAQSIAQTVKSTMDHALDIHSPSKELYKTGVYTGQGQINGMKSTLPEIQRTADKMGQTAIPDDNDRYVPSVSSTTYSRSTSSENNTYAPVFNLTISGTNDDRAMARKVKKWIAETLEETFSSYESKNSPVREV